MLVARYLEQPDGHALDLATGEQVVIVRRRLDPVARIVWPTVVQRVAGLWHPAIAPCVDFGFSAMGEWFEAYDEECRDVGASATAKAFLAACAVDCSLVPMNPARRTAPLMPSFPDDEQRVIGGSGVRPRGFGMRLLPRPLEDAIGQALAEGRRGGPLVWSIDAPPGCGWKTTWRRLARVARLAGYVTIDHTLLELPARPHGRGSWLSALQGLDVVIVAEQRTWQPARRQHLARLLVRLGGLEAVSLIVLDVVRTGRPTPASHQVVPFEPGELASALWLPSVCSRQSVRARRIAGITHGVPGPFVEAITARLGLRRSPPTVHERPTDEHGAAEPARAASAALRRAAALVVRRRSAAADRVLTRAIGAMNRRGLAAPSPLVLARAEVLAARGDIERSQRAWQEVTAVPCDPATLAPMAARIARQWMRHGAIESAARLLVGAVEALRAVDAAVPTDLAVSLMYVRCWQARWHAALEVESTDEGRVGLVWPALELGETEIAVEHLRVARSVPPSIDPRWILAARYRLDIALGAHDRLHQAASETILPAADGLDEDLAMLPVEGLTRLGVPLTIAMRQRMRGYVRPSCPRLTRARARLALAVNACRGAPQSALVDEVGRVVRATGARALAHGVSRISCWRRTPPEATPMLNDLIAVLQSCQAHDDPHVALSHVARLLGERLQADTVMALGRSARGDAALARAGTHDVSGTARRAMDAGAAIVDACEGRSDVGVPVRLGDVTTGALGVRWVMPTGAASAQSVALLEAVATAIAPTVRLAVELAPRVSGPPGGSALLGVSTMMARVRTAVETAARAPFRVLIEGESGSGKELVAREIHKLSPRRTRAFCAINCAALTDELCEAELFGHARGAYTGAVAERAGLFEEADGGTLFLDEVSELSPRAQAKLLRALQEGEIRRLGETRSRRVDVRLISATNRPLADAVAAGAFRADLRYRLDVIHITVPPLRDRAEDIPLLVGQFWQRAIEGVGSRAQLAAEAVAALARYDWPGNVRELQNVLSAVAAEAPARGVVRALALPAHIGTGAARPGLTLEQARRLSDERSIREALLLSGGHRGRAALALGLTRQGLAKLVDRLQLDTTRGAGPPP
jgi:DNA-binding NtrC family response regulator